MFDFDVPSKAYISITEELITLHDTNSTSQEDTWFNEFHPEHEAMRMDEEEETFPAAFNQDSKSVFRRISSRRVSYNNADLESDGENSNNHVTVHEAARSSKENTHSSSACKNDMNEVKMRLDRAPTSSRNSSFKRTAPTSSISARSSTTSTTVLSKKRPLEPASSSNSLNSTTCIIKRAKVESQCKPKSSMRPVQQRKSAPAKMDHDDEQLKALLRQHNQRLAPKSLYTPALYSVRQVRAWEAKSGKSWQELSPNSKSRANEEIAQLIDKR